MEEPMYRLATDEENEQARDQIRNGNALAQETIQARQREKQYGGKIENWWKEDYSGHKNLYGGNLGFIIWGILGKDHRGRGFDNQYIHTSLVVKINEDETQIETLNSIYDLGAKFERSTSN